MRELEKTITDTFRQTDSAIDEQGGWHRVQKEFHDVLDRAERELDWPVDVEIEISITEKKAAETLAGPEDIEE